MGSQATVLCLVFLCAVSTVLSAVLSAPASNRARSPWTYMGCYRDEDQHDLTSAHKLKDTDMTYKMCYDFCSSFNMMYMALQSEDECRCDNGYGIYGSMDESDCDENCAGDSSEICGGDQENSVFKIRESLALGIPYGVLSNDSQSSLSFSVLGDWGNRGSSQRTVAKALGEWSEKHNSQFVLAIGDNFYQSGVTSAYDSQFDDTWKNVYTHRALKTPWIAIEGNHDYYNDNARHQVVRSGVDSQWVMPSLYYTFKQTVGSSTVQFIMLDTDPLHDGDDVHQLRWFEKEMRSSTADWLIVVGHHPVYSSGGHGSARSTMEMFRDVRDELFRAKAAVYICGHDHLLEQLREEQDGTVDFIISGSGSKLDSGHHSSAAANLKSKKVDSRFLAKQYGFVGITMTERLLEVQYVDMRGNLLHSFTKPNPRA